MLNYDTSGFEKQCKDLMKIFNNQLTWSWDERFETVIAQFDIKDKDLVHDNIKSYMGSTWNNENAQTAPELIHLIIDYFGGMQKGQQLLTSDPTGDDIILCAWWPWGNGQTISIRIGIFAQSLSDSENEELSSLLKAWFKL